MVKRHNPQLSRIHSTKLAGAPLSSRVSVPAHDRLPLRTLSSSSTARKPEARTCRAGSKRDAPTDLQTKLKAWKELIETDLETSLPPAEQPPNPPIHTAIRHSILGGGHRYRPILLLAVADILGVNLSDALSLACEVEMIHSASMILDDLPSFDNADFRHGKPSCHKEFGEDIAILASHRLLILCGETNWRLRKDLGPKTGIRLESEYTDLINNMIRGEALDLATTRERIDATKLIDIYIGKSARLFSFAAVSGALLGHASQMEIEALREYGLRIGLAYQILDDIYDVQGSPKSIGKAPGMDTKNRKATTFPILYGVPQSLVLMNKYKREACAQIDQFGNKFAILKQLAEHIAPN